MIQTRSFSPSNFSALDPDCVLNALESVGFRSDGRLLALNSYENRVYEVGMEEGAPLVSKFYRPGRWTDSAILEEHAFVQELAEHEIPVVPALAPDGLTLHRFEGYRFAVFPKYGGRAPELEDRGTLERIGRFLGRIHAIGAIRPFLERPALDSASFGDEPRITCSGTNSFQLILMQPIAARSIRRWTARATASRELGECVYCACTKTATPATCFGLTKGRTSSILTIAEWAQRCRIYGCYCPANAATWHGS